MKFTTGQKIRVVDGRKGTYDAIAADDFEHDNESPQDGFVPVVLDQDKPLKGRARFQIWERSDSIPCRTTLALIYPR